jgi:uncharacterized protein (DUF2141 family)
MASMQLLADDRFNLTVTVKGLIPNQGQVVVSLFDDKKKYLKEVFKEQREKTLDSNSVDVIFSDLTAGDYAFSVYYDLDNDGELDTGMFRIPSEPVAFSNNARGKFGPAKWKHTNFRLEANTQMNIEVLDAIQ